MPAQRGDVLEAWIPFKEGKAAPQGKLRPVVVVGSSPMGPGQDQIVLVVPIIDVKNPLAGDVELADWKKFGLAKPCWIRARRLYGFDPNVLSKSRKGRVSVDVMNEVLREILPFFA